MKLHRYNFKVEFEKPFPYANEKSPTVTISSAASAPPGPVRIELRVYGALEVFELFE